jgi:hypothetical protein
VKRSTPTTPGHSESSQPDVPQGSLSPRQWAPHLSDPDPPQPEMSHEEIKTFVKNVAEFMRNRKK